MDVDEREFFREATLRICGSLDVEKFLYESFMYIRDFIPAEKVYLTHHDRDSGKHVALEQLMAYSWPGNVRELENSVERALILNRGEPLVFHDLSVPLNPEFHFKQGLESEFHPNLQDKNSLALDAVMSGHIRQVLEITGGKVEGKGGAAELLQMNPSTLRKRMRKLSIPFGRKARRM